MKNKYVYLVVSAAVLCLAAAIVIGVGMVNRLSAENEYLKAAFSKYTVANGKNVGKVRALRHEYATISAELGVPLELIDAVQIHENLGAGFEFGVKGIYPGIKDHDPKEWQARAAAHIVTQEAFKYILDDPVLKAEYFKRLGARYCFWHRGAWSKDVRKIYEQEKTSE